MNPKIKLNSEFAKVPTKGSEKSAGYDLYAAVDAVIAPNTVGKIDTGISITPPAGYYGAIFARSGMATKRGLRPANCVGVCDEDYTGNYIVALYNDSSEPQTIEKGDRIAQLIFLPYLDVEFEIVDELEETERGAGGFNSTGTK